MEYYTAMKNSKAQLPTITGTKLTDIALSEVIHQAVRSKRLHSQEAETGKTNQQKEFSLGTGDKGREDACLGRAGTWEPAGGLSELSKPQPLEPKSLPVSMKFYWDTAIPIPLGLYATAFKSQ